MRTTIGGALAAAASWLMLVPSVQPQAIPIGPDFQVGFEGDLAMRVATDADRWFATSCMTVFVWWPYASGWSDRGEYQGGHPLDGYGIGWYWSEGPVDIATVAMDDFMAVWETIPAEPPGVERSFIRGRRISAHGLLLTDPFEVTTSEICHPRDPRVAALPSSRVVVVWADDSSDGTDDSDASIQARLFTIDGVPLGPRFQVNTTTLGNQSLPDVAAAPDGRFAVTWQSESSSGDDDSGTSIQLRRFQADGLPIGIDQQVNTYVASDQTRPRVSCGGDGRFVVVWESAGSSGDDDSSLSVQARAFDASGIPPGADFQVNTYTEEEQSQPSVAMMADGRFEVVWHSEGSVGNDDSGASIQRRAFAADGIGIGDQRQVNTTTDFDQWWPDIAMTAAGDFVVVWADSDGFRGRIYRLPVLADGFESGDCTAWSATVP